MDIGVLPELVWRGGLLMAEDVKVNGVWLNSLGNVSAIKWSTQWGDGPCGSSLASCTVAVDPANTSTLLRINQTFEVFADGVKVFGGVIDEVGRDFPRSISAKGWARRAADFQAVDVDGNPTTNPRTAVTQTITNGLPWSNAAAFDNVSLGVDGEPTMQNLDALLNQWAATVAKRWGTDVNGVAFATADETAVSWFLDASDLDLGVASDGLYTRVRARYYSALDVDGNPTTPLTVTSDDAAGIAEFGVIEYPMPLLDLGMIDATTAGVYADAQLALLTVPQWLSQITTTSQRLLTPGGLSAHLPSVRAGQVVHLFNVPQALGGLWSELGVNVVLGQAQYDAENPKQITIGPVGLAVRDLAGLAAQSKRAAA